MKRYCRTLFLAAALAVLAVGAAAARANTIPVGSGANHSQLVVNFGDGAAYDFDVAYDAPVTGLGLFDIIQAETTLTTDRIWWDKFKAWTIDGIGYDGHSDSGWMGGENYWHYWVRDSASDPWSYSLEGVDVRAAADGTGDGWVYGSVGEPIIPGGGGGGGGDIPEPATLLLFGIGLAALGRRVRRGMG